MVTSIRLPAQMILQSSWLYRSILSCSQIRLPTPTGGRADLPVRGRGRVDVDAESGAAGAPVLLPAGVPRGDEVQPTPATHAISTRLKAGATVRQRVSRAKDSVSHTLLD